MEENLEHRPWEEQRRNVAASELSALRIRKSWLIAEVGKVDTQISEIEAFVRDSFNPEYGRTETALDYVPKSRKFSIKEIIRNLMGF